MKTPNLIVRIPEPCHEDWNSMQPDAKGKFCNSCSKAVFDFSTKTDQEIKHILMEYKDQKVCGHFKKSQVDRPLNFKVNLNDLPKNMSFSKAFVIAVFLVFGSFLFSCKDQQDQILGDLTFEIPKENESVEEIYTAGMAIMQVPDSVLNSIIKDSAAVDEIFTEGIMTGDVVCTSDNVKGDLKFDETYPEVTIGEGIIIDTVNLEEVPIMDYIDPLMDVVTMTGAVSVTETTNCFAHPDINDSVDKNDELENNNIKMRQIENQLSIFPNPSNGEFNVSYVVLKRSYVNLTIYSINGALMNTVVDSTRQYEGKYQIPVNLNELPNGIYLVTLIIGDKKSVERLVIER
ncbi:MAG: T9SS type A sorting domain-containing protein [Bacteroidota bacterium]